MRGEGGGDYLLWDSVRFGVDEFLVLRLAPMVEPPPYPMLMPIPFRSYMILHPIPLCCPLILSVVSSPSTLSLIVVVVHILSMASHIINLPLSNLNHLIHLR